MCVRLADDVGKRVCTYVCGAIDVCNIILYVICRSIRRRLLLLLISAVCTVLNNSRSLPFAARGTYRLFSVSTVIHRTVADTSRGFLLF